LGFSRNNNRQQTGYFAFHDQNKSRMSHNTTSIFNIAAYISIDMPKIPDLPLLITLRLENVIKIQVFSTTTGYFWQYFLHSKLTSLE